MIALKTAHGTYLTAAKNTGHVVADRAEAAAWETFALERISDTQVALRTSFGTYLTAEDGGGRELACNRTTRGAWEVFGYWIRDGHASLQAANGLWVRVGDAAEGFAVSATADHPEAWETFAVEDVAGPEDPGVGAHPDPVRGRIRVIDGVALGDDSGRRTFALMHAGDLVARWMAGGRDQVLADLDAIARGGYHVVRPWWHLRPNAWPWNEGGDPRYNGCDAFAPGFVEKGIEFALATHARGLRTAIGAGGLDKITTAQEQELMRIFRRIIDGAGHECFAWTEPVNEPSSVHATTDDDGDNTPEHLRMLSKIMTDGTGIVWHIGYGSNTDFGGPRGDGQNMGRFDQQRYTLDDQPVGCTHPYRAGHVWDKIRHWFSWVYEVPGKKKRLWLYQEGIGQPTSGPPLRYVSVVENGGELDAEALALLAAVASFRGMGGSMSGTGVQRFEPFTNIVGFSEIPWLIAQLPRDIHTFEHIHHAGDTWRAFRTLVPKGQVRFDGVSADDGQRVFVGYGPPTNDSFAVEHGFDGVVCNPKTKTVESVRWSAGQTVPLAFERGRLFVGRVR
jgi:hypothetical protein